MYRAASRLARWNGLPPISASGCASWPRGSAVTGQERLLEKRRVLGRAVQLRNPYVDALSLIQLRALRGLRCDDDARAAAGDGDGGAGGAVVGSGGERDVDGLRRLLLLSVNGIAAGLQNTG